MHSYKSSLCFVTLDMFLSESSCWYWTLFRLHAIHSKCLLLLLQTNLTRVLYLCRARSLQSEAGGHIE
jgi:hypothetical protein